jgi:hypothetical protein
MIIPNSPHNGILITIAGLILSAPFFIWAFVLYKRQQKQREVEQKPVPVPPPLDRSVKEKLPDGRTLTSYPPRVILGSPGSEDKMQKVMFKTEAGGEVHIPTSGSPRVLRFLRPHEVTIREEELPKEFPTGDGRIVVKKFTTTGFIIEEISTHNVQVEAEVYLKHNSN